MNTKIAEHGMLRWPICLLLMLTAAILFYGCKGEEPTPVPKQAAPQTGEAKISQPAAPVAPARRAAALARHRDPGAARGGDAGAGR